MYVVAMQDIDREFIELPAQADRVALLPKKLEGLDDPDFPSQLNPRRKLVE
ncbi:MAG: hypothetical protein R3F37_13345 [Candidatus Competibacteraceae bacterium]